MTGSRGCQDFPAEQSHNMVISRRISHFTRVTWDARWGLIRTKLQPWSSSFVGLLFRMCQLLPTAEGRTLIDLTAYGPK